MIASSLAFPREAGEINALGILFGGVRCLSPAARRSSNQQLRPSKKICRGVRHADTGADQTILIEVVVVSEGPLQAARSSADARACARGCRRWRSRAPWRRDRAPPRKGKLPAISSNIPGQKKQRTSLSVFRLRSSSCGTSPASVRRDRGADISRRPSPDYRAIPENPSVRFGRNTRQAASKAARASSKLAAVPVVHSRGWLPG